MWLLICSPEDCRLGYIRNQDSSGSIVSTVAVLSHGVDYFFLSLSSTIEKAPHEKKFENYIFTGGYLKKKASSIFRPADLKKKRKN